MKSDQQVIQDRDDIEYIKRPHLWAHGWFVPVKQRMVAGDIKVGVLMNDRAGGYKVLENMTMFGTSFGEPVIEHEYLTPEAVATAGWIVD